LVVFCDNSPSFEGFFLQKRHINSKRTVKFKESIGKKQGILREKAGKNMQNSREKAGNFFQNGREKVGNLGKSNEK